MSSNKLSFQLSFAATGLKCAERTRCPTARFKARVARPPPNCGGHARRDSRDARARNLKWPTYRRAGNPNNKHGHYYVQHEAAADDDPLVQTNFIYQDADFRGGRNPVCPRCRLRDVCRPQVHYRHVQLRRIRKVPRVLFVSFMVRMLLRLGDGGITVMITPSPPAPSNVHSSIAARRSTRLLVVPTYRSDLV